MTKREILIKYLSVEVSSLAIEEIRRVRGEEYLDKQTYEKASSELSGGFNWESSRQGKKYWEAIQRELYRKEDKQSKTKACCVSTVANGNDL